MESPALSMINEEKGKACGESSMRYDDNVANATCSEIKIIEKNHDKVKRL